MAKKKETTWAGVVQRLLDETGLTPYRLAKLAGLTQVGVLGVKNGHRTPSADTLERMLFAAGLDWEWLGRVKVNALLLPKGKRK